MRLFSKETVIAHHHFNTDGLQDLNSAVMWLASIYSSSCWYRCMIGLACAVTGGVLSSGLLFTRSDELVFSCLYPAVALGALFGGLLSGLIALLASAILAYVYFVPARDGLASAELFIFIASSIVISVACEILHKACLTMLNYEKRRADIETLARISLEESPPTDQIGKWDFNCETQTCDDIGNTRKMMGLMPNMPLSLFTHLDIIRAEDRSKTQKAFMAALEPDGPGIYEAEYRIIRPVDGAERWITSRGQAYFNNGTPVHVIGVSTDITEKKRTERITKEKAQLALQLETIALALPGALYAFREDAEGKSNCPYAAPHTMEILGLDPCDLALDASEIYKRVHPDDYPEFRSSFYKSKHELTLWGNCFRFHHPQKGMIWLETQAAPVLEPDGSTIWHGYVQDVTLRKQAEANLAESEERLRAVIDGAGDAIISINDTGIIQSVNTTCIQMFQYSADELLGQNIHILMTEPDRMRHDYYLQNFASHRKNPVRFNRELQGQRKDGSVFPLDLSVSEARYDHKRLFVGFIRDLSELNKIKAHVERLQTERMTAMGGMAAALSHEINQPLSAAAAYVQTAQLLFDMPADKRPEDAHDILGLAADQILRAGRIVSHLRKFILLGEPDKIFYSLHELIRHIHVVMNDYILNENITMAYKLTAPDDRVLIDPVQINQVLMNLIRNAIEAMKDALNRELIIATAPCEAGMIQIDVIDHGDGLNKDTEANLFVPFTTTKSDGMGLGLSISRAIIEAHHGKIWTGHNPEGGTIFSFTLPLASTGGTDEH